MSERQSVPGSAEERFEPVQEAFRELNEFLADTVSAYEYDVAAGLERLKVGLATDGAEQPAECRISIDSLGLQITEYLITSLSSPEFAEFIPSRQGGSWLLS